MPISVTTSAEVGPPPCWAVFGGRRHRSSPIHFLFSICFVFVFYPPGFYSPIFLFNPLFPTRLCACLLIVHAGTCWLVMFAGLCIYARYFRVTGISPHLEYCLYTGDVVEFNTMYTHLCSPAPDSPTA